MADPSRTDARTAEAAAKTPRSHRNFAPPPSPPRFPPLLSPIYHNATMQPNGADCICNRREGMTWSSYSVMNRFRPRSLGAAPSEDAAEPRRHADAFRVGGGLRGLLPPASARGAPLEPRRTGGSGQREESRRQGLLPPSPSPPAPSFLLPPPPSSPNDASRVTLRGRKKWRRF